MIFLLAIPVLVIDLTLSDGGLVESGATGQWEWADPTSGPVGEGAAWGTNPNGLYLHDTQDYLEVVLPNLGALTEPTLTIEHWYAIEPGDRGELEINAGFGYQRVEPIGGYPDPAGFVGHSLGYTIDALDLVGMTGPAQVRFAFTADAAVADEGWFVRQIVLWDGDVVPPTLTATVLPVDTQELAAPYVIELQIEDNAPLVDATVYYTTNGGALLDVPLVDQGADQWRAEIPAQGPDTVIEWYAEAEDGEQVGRYPAAGTESFRVFLAAPTDVEGPDGPRLVAKTVPLSWSPPISPHPVLGYSVRQDGNAPIATTGTELEVTLSPDDSQVFTVTAEYPAGLGDPSESVALDIEVPELISVEPPALYQGQQAYITLAGASLYLLDGQSELDLGPGIEVLELDVRDVNQLTAKVQVDDVAEVRLWDVEITGTQGRQIFERRFEVLDGADAPRIRQITPDTLEQGDEVMVTAVATDAFASDELVAEGDEDLVVTGPVSVDGKTATFGLAANTRARIGAHTVVLDDGVNLWTIDVQVDEYVVPPQTGCHSGASPASWGWLTLLPIAWLTRRRAAPSRPRAPDATDR